jgi:hypothetical protein
MKMRAAWLRLAVALLAFWPFTVKVSAHQFAHPKVEAVTIEKNRIQVEIQYDLSPGDEPKNIRKLFDTDQNGQIDATEVEKLLDYLEAGCGGLVLRLDDKKTIFKRVSRDAKQAEGQVDRASEINFHLIVEASVDISSGLHWVTLSERSRLGVVPVGVKLSAPLQFVTSSQAPLDFVLNRMGPAHIGDKEVLTLVFVTP